MNDPLAGSPSAAPPAAITRAEGVWLHDAEGRLYLDAADGRVPAGHGQPQVVEAIGRQAALALPARCPGDLQGMLTERLAATLNRDLSRAMFTGSGVEANDLALRLAQTATGRRGIVAVAGNRHGHTALLAQLCSDHPAGGGGAQFRIVPAPDPLRAGEADPDEQARRFSRDVALAIADLEDLGIGFAGLILCPVLADQGLPAIPPGFFAPTEALVRRSGGLLIADETQAGFGRLGSHFWGHARQGLAPDVVTMGEAMANGFPAGAVFARPEIVEAMRDEAAPLPGPAHPLATAAALATLDALERQDLQRQAAETGRHLAKVLEAVRGPTLAAIRGTGLLLGTEVLLAGGDTPDPDAATRLAGALRTEGVLVARAGQRGATLILRPPLTMSRDEAALLAAGFSRAFSAVG